MSYGHWDLKEAYSIFTGTNPQPQKPTEKDLYSAFLSIRMADSGMDLNEIAQVMKDQFLFPPELVNAYINQMSGEGGEA